MDEAEFDKFAEEYKQLHGQNIKISGENTEFFAEYKVRDVASIFSSIERTGQLKILDFGSGIGASVPYFRKYFPNSKIICLDVSKKSLAVAAARCGAEAEFIHFSGSDIPIEDSYFDLAFSACVFHHIDHDEHHALLREIRRVLKINGRAFVFEHNPYNPLTVHAVNTCQFDACAVLVKPKLLGSELRRVGFHNVVRRYRIFFPGWLRFLRPLEKSMTWFPLGAQYYVSGVK